MKFEGDLIGVAVVTGYERPKSVNLWNLAKSALDQRYVIFGSVRLSNAGPLRDQPAYPALQIQMSHA